ncbi:hypothetical protein QYE76_034300 [Lolium multiflorum]|uniref:RNase H type-1 domain-containing protein n=1 Tax=Lolium multiflorum TaxID=4521 RepID=A0AAD8QXS7_LOLMU|nr:hypothetical protein QYE76_034300 [Lolium multiflorum]
MVVHSGLLGNPHQCYGKITPMGSKPHMLRDHNGDFILSLSEGVEGFPFLELAEALVVRRALTVARSHGVTKVVLVSDFLSLIQRLSSPRQDRSILGSVIRDIKTIMTDFESCLFNFASCRLNVVAHKLVRSAEPIVCNIFVGVTLELIRVQLCNDVF